MNRGVVAAWVVAALCVIGAIGVAVERPTHWERTVAVAAVVAVVAAAIAVYQSRRSSPR